MGVVILLLNVKAGTTCLFNKGKEVKSCEISAYPHGKKIRERLCLVCGFTINPRILQHNLLGRLQICYLGSVSTPHAHIVFKRDIIDKINNYSKVISVANLITETEFKKR